ncbi:cyclase family protein [Streptomyces sp. 8N616]|uniref:cyclase family protein n=1 Tax=Streptomyces sp. 8N616 TaxID=3457414 RepID=UPI003FD0CCE5
MNPVREDGGTALEGSRVPAGSPFGGHTHEFVDLTLLIAEDLPCYWPTHQPFQHKTWNWFRDQRDPAATVRNRTGPYATRWMAIDEHTGTHVDAPSHFIPPPGSGLAHSGPAAAVSADGIPLSQTIGPAAVIDLTDLPEGTEAGVSPLVTPASIESWEDAHGRLGSADIILLHTGWDRHYQRGQAGEAYLGDAVRGSRPAWPAPDVATVELLLERGVRCIGTDAPSIGPAHGDLGQAVHVAGLGRGAVFIECLTGLDRLPPRGAWFCFLPLKVEGATGAPGRAIASVPAAAYPPEPRHARGR